MSADDNNRSGSRSAPPDQGALCCAAPGCSWAGSAGETGRFLCIAHQGSECAQWHAITERTADLTWFATFIADVQRMANFPRKGEQPWAAYASQFWLNTDTTMQPVQLEVRHPERYMYRLFGELRAMALGKDRPAPHVPQGQWPGFQSKQQPATAAVSVVAALPPVLPSAPAARRADRRAESGAEPPAWILDNVPLADDPSFSGADHMTAEA